MALRKRNILLSKSRQAKLLCLLSKQMILKSLAPFANNEQQNPSLIVYLSSTLHLHPRGISISIHCYDTSPGQAALQVETPSAKECHGCSPLMVHSQVQIDQISHRSCCSFSEEKLSWNLFAQSPLCFTPSSPATTAQ